MFNCHYFNPAHTTECMSGDMEYVIMWPLHGDPCRIIGWASIIGHEHMLTLSVRWPQEEEEEEYFFTEEEVKERINFFKTLSYLSRPLWFCELPSGTVLRSAQIP